MTHVAGKLLPDPDGVARLAEETLHDIGRGVGWAYAWPGNFRELEQCVRNVLVRGTYRPTQAKTGGRPLGEQVEAVELTADALLARYCALAVARTGSYVAAGKALGMDRRSVRARALAFT